jgi:hypothetical protein
MKRVRISQLEGHLSGHLRAAEEDTSSLEIVPASRSFASARRMRLPALRLAKSSLDALKQERGER